jgi:alpha-1,3-rhamnosyltransferase
MEKPKTHKPSGPLVSVIVPSYNHEAYIENCIESVLNQTYENIELIVIDDGSTDKSKLRIAPLASKHRFKYISQDNAGLPATLNRGLSEARGEYVSILASDDEFLPWKIQVLVDIFQNQEQSCAVIFGDADFIDQNGENLCTSGQRKYQGTFISHYVNSGTKSLRRVTLGTYESLVLGNYIPAMSTLIRRDAIFAVGGFDQDMLVEDWSIWLKLSKKFSFIHYPEIVAKYRVHGLNSIDTITARLAEDSLKLINRERDYCQANGLLTAWRQGYHFALYNYKRCSGWRRCLRRLSALDMLPFFGYVIRRVFGRNFTILLTGSSF